MFGFGCFVCLGLGGNGESGKWEVEVSGEVVVVVFRVESGFLGEDFGVEEFFG